MEESYKGKYSWLFFKPAINASVLRDEEKRDILYQKPGVKGELLRIYLDVEFLEPLLSVKASTYSRLNPPYWINSCQSGDRLGYVQLVDETMLARQYRMRIDADQLDVQFAQSSNVPNEYAVSSEGNRIATITHAYSTWSNSHLNVNFPANRMNFVMLAAACNFVLYKEYLDSYPGHNPYSNFSW